MGLPRDCDKTGEVGPIDCIGDREPCMEYRRIGKFGLTVSPIILSAWQYGCERYWGDVPTKDAFDVIARAVDKSINTDDTAVGYDGSEEIAGKAIRKIRHRLIVISKGGADPTRWESESISTFPG